MDSVESATAAQRGGASRLELCANLDVGGTTPSATLIAEVRTRVRLPTAVMIRPRGGSFVHTIAEIDAMVRSIAMARSFGVEALVFGVLDEDNYIDVPQMRILMAAARGTPVVFHRAFDELPDLHEGLDTLIELGVARVLTSGGANTALAGAVTIGELVTEARGRIAVMAGGKVRGRTIREIVQLSGVREVHARCENDDRQIRGILDVLTFGM